MTKGDIKLTIKYGIIPIISMDLQLCDEVKAIGLQCPLEPKTYDGKLSVDIPSAIPGVSHPVYCMACLKSDIWISVDSAI